MFGASFYNIDTFVNFLISKISQSCDLYEVSINQFIMKAHYVTLIALDEAEPLISDALIDALGISKKSGRAATELDLKNVLEPIVLQSIREKMPALTRRGLLMDTPTNLLTQMRVGGRISLGKTIFVHHIWKTDYNPGFKNITDTAELVTVYIRTEKNEDSSVQTWCKDTKQARAEQLINPTL